MLCCVCLRFFRVLVVVLSCVVFCGVCGFLMIMFII